MVDNKVLDGWITFRERISYQAGQLATELIELADESPGLFLNKKGDLSGYTRTAYLIIAIDLLNVAIEYNTLSKDRLQRGKAKVVLASEMHDLAESRKLFSEAFNDTNASRHARGSDVDRRWNKLARLGLEGKLVAASEGSQMSFPYPEEDKMEMASQARELGKLVELLAYEPQSMYVDDTGPHGFGKLELLNVSETLYSLSVAFRGFPADYASRGKNRINLADVTQESDDRNSLYFLAKDDMESGIAVKNGGKSQFWLAVARTRVGSNLNFTDKKYWFNMALDNINKAIGARPQDHWCHHWKGYVLAKLAMENTYMVAKYEGLQTALRSYHRANSLMKDPITYEAMGDIQKELMGLSLDVADRKILRESIIYNYNACYNLNKISRVWNKIQDAKTLSEF